MNDFDIWMIRVKGNEVSETYAEICSKTWTDAGFEIIMFDAITPDEVQYYPHIKWGKKPNEVEKACLLSHYLLWQGCADKNHPTLILEHDAYLKKPEYITYNPFVDITYFGQHCMEAVMFNPSYARLLCDVVENNPVNGGPFSLCEHFIGLNFRNDKRIRNMSRYARPCLRYLGPEAPVRHAIIPRFGSMIEHKKKENMQTSDRLAYEPELFEIIDA